MVDLHYQVVRKAYQLTQQKTFYNVTALKSETDQIVQSITDKPDKDISLKYLLMAIKSITVENIQALNR